MPWRVNGGGRSVFWNGLFEREGLFEGVCKMYCKMFWEHRGSMGIHGTGTNGIFSYPMDPSTS